MATATVTSSYALSLTILPTGSLPGGSFVSETLGFTGNGLGGVPSGSLYSAVYGSPGSYTFVYRVTDTGASSITELTLNGFIPSIGIVGNNLYYVTASGTTVPTTASLLVTGNIQVGFETTAGSGVGISASGGTSDYLVVNTTATSYGNFPAGVIDGGVAPGTAYGPSVPDGGMTIMLLGGALSGMALLRRKLA